MPKEKKKIKVKKQVQKVVVSQDENGQPKEVICNEEVEVEVEVEVEEDDCNKKGANNNNSNEAKVDNNGFN